jgi:hypothetical protein
MGVAADRVAPVHDSNGRVGSLAASYIRVGAPAMRGLRRSAVKSRQARGMRPARIPGPRWCAGCSRRGMSFAIIVNRVRSEFVEMPGLELTMPQAVRLWSLGADDCRAVIDALVDAGFLRWTVRRTVMRTGPDAGAGRHAPHIPVRVRSEPDKSVDFAPGEPGR